jgi:hypothetical protein
MTLQEIDPNIAHIQDGGEYFQVLNTEGTDWDEEATQALYELERA